MSVSLVQAHANLSVQKGQSDDDDLIPWTPPPQHNTQQRNPRSADTRMHRAGQYRPHIHIRMYMYVCVYPWSRRADSRPP